MGGSKTLSSKDGFVCEDCTAGKDYFNEVRDD